MEPSNSSSEKNVGIASKLSLYDDCSLFVYVSCCKKYYVIGRTVTHIIKKNYDFFSQFFFIGVKYITESFIPQNRSNT